MSTQPEALRLADEMERVAEYDHQIQAAAELRRLHEVNQELLELVGDVLAFVENDWNVPIELINAARAAIAKATGEQT